MSVCFKIVCRDCRVDVCRDCRYVGVDVGSNNSRTVEWPDMVFLFLWGHQGHHLLFISDAGETQDLYLDALRFEDLGVLDTDDTDDLD